MKIVTRTLKRAFTFTEIVMTILLLSMIFLPVMGLYRFTVRSSTNAMATQELIAIGRKISSQIRDDLKNSCFPFKGAFSLSFDDMLSVKTSDSTGLEGVEYSFYRFPSDNKVESNIKRDAHFYTQSLVKIVYRLEKSQSCPLLKLIRTEIFPGKPEKLSVLSDQVNFFHIKKIPLKLNDGFRSGVFNVYFQLANTTEKNRFENSKTTKSSPIIAINEFYEVIGSDFFSHLAKFPESVRNWNTALTY